MEHAQSTFHKITLVIFDMTKGLLLCATVAAVITYFFEAKFGSTIFFVWSALFLNGCIATWEDAMPGGFDNTDGQVPKSLRGTGRWWFWLTTLLGTITSAGFGIYLFHLGY